MSDVWHLTVREGEFTEGRGAWVVCSGRTLAIWLFAWGDRTQGRTSRGVGGPVASSDRAISGHGRDVD